MIGSKEMISVRTVFVPEMVSISLLWNEAEFKSEEYGALVP
jgi:hypothetical protein